MRRRNVDVEDDLGLSNIKIAETEEEKRQLSKKIAELQIKGLRRFREIREKQGLSLIYEKIVLKQLNLEDRTALLFDMQEDWTIPAKVHIDGFTYEIKGISCGVKPPFLSVEIEKQEKNLENKIAFLTDY